MKLFVGLDIGLNKTALCCIDAKGKTVLACMVASEPSAIIAKLNKLRTQIELIGLLP